MMLEPAIRTSTKGAVIANHVPKGISEMREKVSAWRTANTRHTAASVPENDAKKAALKASTLKR